jgi:cyclase
VLAASIFHYRTYTIDQAKAYLHEQGIPVRLLIPVVPNAVSTR